MLITKKLPSTFLKDTSFGCYVFCDKYISNGAWAIERCLIKDSYQYCPPNKEKRYDVNRLFKRFEGAQDLRTYNITGKLFDLNFCRKSSKKLRPQFVRIFASGEQEVLFSEAAIQFFGITELQGNDLNNAFIGLNGMFIIVPMRKTENV